MPGINKKILSIIVTAALLTLGITAYADEMTIPGDNTVFIPQEEAVLLPELNVIVPTSIDFVIAPFAAGENGQIYSEPCDFFNESDVDVLITFTEISLITAEGSEVIPLSYPFAQNDLSPNKEIYMQLDFGREDILPVVITGAAQTETPSVILSAAGAESSILSLDITGNVTPNLSWQSGDVKVSLTCHIEPMSGAEDMIIGYLPTQEVPVTPVTPNEGAAPAGLPANQPGEEPRENLEEEPDEPEITTDETLNNEEETQQDFEEPQEQAEEDFEEPQEQAEEETEEPEPSEPGAAAQDMPPAGT